jgi:hypothetical protein
MKIKTPNIKLENSNPPNQPHKLKILIQKEKKRVKLQCVPLLPILTRMSVALLYLQIFRQSSNSTRNAELLRSWFQAVN